MVETSTALVVSVDAQGVSIAFNGANQRVDWDTLHRAARQDDPELRRVYGELLKDAEEKASRGPVTITVEQDDTNVYWLACVRAAWGGGPSGYRRAADEGGTHYSYEDAEWEAKDIARKLRKQGRVVTLDL